MRLTYLHTRVHNPTYSGELTCALSRSTQRPAMCNFADLMGRAALHSGRVITWDEMYNSKFQFVDNIDAVNYDSEPPVKANADSYYPVPVPGEWSET